MARRRVTPQQMFVGPLVTIRNPATNRVIRVEFEFFGVAAQQSMILAYGGVTEARVQRKLIAAAENVAVIPSKRLLGAIKRALREAYPRGQKARPEAPRGQE